MSIEYVDKRSRYNVRYVDKRREEAMSIKEEIME